MLLLEHHHVFESLLFQEVFISATVQLVQFSVDLPLDFIVVTVLLPLKCLVLGMQAFEENALEFGLDVVQVRQIRLSLLGCDIFTHLVVILSSVHLEEQQSIHTKHFALLVQMVVHIVIALVSKFDFFEVHFNADV